MAKFRQFLAKPAVTAVLLVLAVALLGGGGIGGARAALNQQSEVYQSQVDLPTVGVQLLENGNPVSDDGTLLSGLLTQSGGKLLPGRRYDEVLTVSNSGTVPAFVRVTVQAYWLDKAGNKTAKMDSDWIKPEFGTDGWVKDEASSTEERTVLYYSSALEGESSPFLTGLTLDGDIIKKVTQTRDPETGTPATITTTYDYDGYSLCLKATVDAVQTHNGQDAVKSAWGRNVTVSGNSISLN